MTFAVGDRVELISHANWKGERGTVGVYREGSKLGPAIQVHFDNPIVEVMQSYESGWRANRFIKVDDVNSFIPEDWS